MSFFLIGVSSYGQSRKELENRRKKIKKEIKQMNSLLFNTKKKKDNALDDLKDLNQKISARERLIETIDLEAQELATEIKGNEREIKKNNKELSTLKKDYSDMVVKTYKSKSQQSKTMFLLSSKNFYQAYKRLKYMQQYSDFRKKQGEEIMLKIALIEKLNDSLAKRKKAKESLLADEKDQKDAIEKDKKSQESLVTKIKKQERKYKRSLQNKLKEEKRITARIDKLIRAAIARANKNKKGAKKSSGFVLNAAEKKLLANFEQNKGNLPWPVNGIITRKFGVQPHPTFPGIKINSPGLHIVTKSKANAQSIFNGKVLTIQANNDGKKSVLIQHGNYISAYNNLESVSVKKGDVVKTGDTVGKVFTDKVSGKTRLGFILYKNLTRLNPQHWIRKN
ncbi:murein hydrolase activator EnvC family protein [Tenacibaculum sp. 190130A14a]|uniref:murein hydrolase activator EnvC family protein n=1 Tax=Tenacibaculum polynesiense TaxID=3137857 RepID=UPI0032B10C70